MSDQLVVFEEKKLEVVYSENGDIEISETPEDKLVKGKEYLSKHEYDLAVYWLTEAAIDYNAEAYGLLGDIHSMSDSGYKDSNKALSYYEKAYELDNSSKKVIYNLAIGYYNERDYKKSFSYLEKCIKLDVDVYFINSSKAECNFILGNFYLSPHSIEQEIETTIDGRIYKYTTTIEYVPKQKNISKAIECYEQAINLNQNNPNYIIKLADLYKNELRNQMQAIYYLRKCQHIVTSETKKQSKCIESFVRIGTETNFLDPASSMELLKVAHALDENNPSLLVHLGSNYYFAKDEQNAIYYLEKCLSTQSLDEIVYVYDIRSHTQCAYYLGKIYGSLNSQKYDLIKSVEYYQKMYDLQESFHIKLRGMSEDGLFNLAISYKTIKNFEKAETYLKECIKELNYQQGSMCANFLGEIYVNEKKDLNKAVEYFELAYKLDDSKLGYIISLSSVYNAINNPEKESLYLKKCANFSSYFSFQDKQIIANCAKMIGLIAYNNKDYVEALEYYKKAYNIDKANPNTAWNLGIIYRTIHDEDNAKYYFEECQKIPNGDIQIIAQCTEMLGMFHD